MCLILFAVQQDPDFPLVVVANRDEAYARPTRRGHFWQDEPQIFGGRDEEAGGSWMAVTRNGRFAAVTNYREANPPGGDLLSRGELVKNFLLGDSVDAVYYLEGIRKQKHRYAGFNLLVGTAEQLWCYSNREEDIVAIEPGVHGLSNGSLNEPWPKVTSGKQALQERLESNASLEEFQEILLDTTRSELAHLPDTGIGLEAEEMLSSRFITTETYGTCTTTVLRIDYNNDIEWLEQYFDNSGPLGERKTWRVDEKV